VGSWPPLSNWADLRASWVGDSAQFVGSWPPRSNWADLRTCWVGDSAQFAVIQRW